MGWGIVGYHQDRRLAAGDEISGDAIQEVWVQPVEIMKILVDLLLADVVSVRQ